MKTLVELKQEPDDLEQNFISDCAAVDRYMNDIKNTFILIAWRLRDMKDHFAIQNSGYQNIYDFAEDRFGIARTTTKNLLTIADRFTEHCHLLPKYSDYNYSQLAELASVPEDEISKFTPEMTIKQMRELKKNGQTSDQITPLEELSAAVSKEPYVSTGIFEGELLYDEGKTFRILPGELIGSRSGQRHIKDVLGGVDVTDVGHFNTFLLEGGEYVAVPTYGNKYYKKNGQTSCIEEPQAAEIPEEDIEDAIVEEIDGNPDEISETDSEYYDAIHSYDDSDAELQYEKNNTTNGLEYLLKNGQTSDQADIKPVTLPRRYQPGDWIIYKAAGGRYGIGQVFCEFNKEFRCYTIHPEYLTQPNWYQNTVQARDVIGQIDNQFIEIIQNGKESKYRGQVKLFEDKQI